ncbi:hypothetical protein HYC85_006126 [Camellia sinensis]|uniref:Uncharacterized protein n=1 Tax=Camellia sinensis TaxID=4442 RepID=A0A7J7I2W6_CAMSI|nr:hypothetical protein HYC85_006126 [Camellia sinensis]
MALLLACCRKASDPKALPSIPLVWNTIIGVLLFVATSLFLKDTETPIKASQRVEKNARRIIRRTVNLDDVKLIKKAMNARESTAIVKFSETIHNVLLYELVATVIS